MAIRTIKRLNPLNDYLFQIMMGEEGDEEQLTSFLNAVLARTGRAPLFSIQIVANRKLPARLIAEKCAILDVRAVTADGSRINIEVQLQNSDDMGKRVLFYWSKQYIRDVKAGQTYSEIPPVISINLVNYKFDDSDDFHSCYHLREDRNHDLILTNAMEIHIVDMVKFRRLRGKDKSIPLHRWLMFLNKNTKQEDLNEVINMDTAIQKADKKMATVMTSKKAMRLYEMREFALMEYNSKIKAGEDRGLAKGRAEREVEIILNLHEMGRPIDEIAKIVKRSKADVFRVLDTN